MQFMCILCDRNRNILNIFSPEIGLILFSRDIYLPFKNLNMSTSYYNIPNRITQNLSIYVCMYRRIFLTVGSSQCAGFFSSCQWWGSCRFSGTLNENVQHLSCPKLVLDASVRGRAEKCIISWSPANGHRHGREKDPRVRQKAAELAGAAKDCTRPDIAQN